MNDDRFANLALTLSFEFQKYLMQHPDLAEEIPPGAVVAFELEGQTDFNQWSGAMARREKDAGRRTVTVRVGAMTPPLSRIEKAELLAT